MFYAHRTRLAKSSAKLCLRSEVTAWDAIFAIHLYEESLLLRTGILLLYMPSVQGRIIVGAVMHVPRPITFTVHKYVEKKLCKNNVLVGITVIDKKAQLSLTNPRDACEKFAHDLGKSSGVVSCIARLPIDSLPMVSYYVLYSNCL